MKKEALREYLSHNCKGRSEAIGGVRLQRTLHTSENELRKAVNRLRREGAPIASDQTGYFYAQTAGEVYSTIRSLKKMRSGLDAAIEGLEASLNSFGGREE
jgi:biotin operon repressor